MIIISYCFLIVFTISFLNAKIRNKKLIYKTIKFFFKILFLPVKLISFIWKRYSKNQAIKNKLIAKEQLKKQRIENKINAIKENLNK